MELHNTYYPQNIRKEKSRKMKWDGHVACMESWVKRTNFSHESLEGKVNSEDVIVDGT